MIKERKHTDEVEYETEVGTFRAYRKERLQIGGGYKLRWDLWAPENHSYPVAQNLTLAQTDKLVRLALKQTDEPTPVQWRHLREEARA